jgi:arylsulfatase A-like enzyme
MRTAVLLALLLAAILARGSQQIITAQAAPARPNVLVIVTDDQPTDTLEVMPQTRRWIREAGREFTQAFVTTPLCCPSRATIMTGRYAHNHRVKRNKDSGLLNQQTTLQRYLGNAGYKTAVAGKYLTSWPMTSNPPYFDRWAIMPGGSRYSYYNFPASVHNSQPNVRTVHGYLIDPVGSSQYSYTYSPANMSGFQHAVDQYSTDWVSDRVIGFLDWFERTDASPWLLFVKPTAPHKPFTPEPAYAEAPVSGWSGNSAVEEADRSGKPPVVQQKSSTLAAGQATRRQQLRTLMSVDDLIGRMFTQLESLGELSSTLVIFTSDNGYLWGEHGLDQWKHFPYTPSVQVPLLIRWPGHLAPGSTDGRLAANIDLVPTILDATGVSPTLVAPLDGRSLLDVWDRDHLLIEYWLDGNDPEIPRWNSYRSREVQYVEWLKDGAVTFREYYDLRADPWQLTNLLADGDPSNPDVSAIQSTLLRDTTCVGAGCP